MPTQQPENDSHSLAMLALLASPFLLTEPGRQVARKAFSHVKDAFIPARTAIVNSTKAIAPAEEAVGGIAKMMEEVAPKAKQVDEVPFFLKPRPKDRFPKTKVYKSLYNITEPQEVRKLISLIEPQEPGSPFRRISTGSRTDLAAIHPEVAKDWLAILESEDVKDVDAVRELVHYVRTGKK